MPPNSRWRLSRSRRVLTVLMLALLAGAGAVVLIVPADAAEQLTKRADVVQTDLPPSQAPSWCVERLWDNNRTEMCTKEFTAWAIKVRRCVNGVCQVVRLGEIMFYTAYHVVTEPNSGTWQINMEIRGGDYWGEGAGGLKVKPIFRCSGRCFPRGDPGEQTVGPGGIATFRGLIDAPIAGPGDQARSRPIASYETTPNLPNALTTKHNDVTTPASLVVRCDSALPGGSFVGCVVPSTTPTWQVPGDFPSFASHVAAAQHSGLPRTLTRLTNHALIEENRKVSCPRVRTRPPGLPPIEDPPGGPAPPPRPSFQCDEYPFASSYQGAAMAGGQGRTFPWCGIPRLPQGVTGPGFSACMIPAGENERAGGALNQFFLANRVIDGDAYHVEVTGGP